MLIPIRFHMHFAQAEPVLTEEKEHPKPSLERLWENLADFVRNISRIKENLYQDVT